MKWIAGLIGAAIGLIAGYRGITYAGCTWLWPQSNLCGIMGVPAAFFGALCGFALAFWTTSKLREQK